MRQDMDDLDVQYPELRPHPVDNLHGDIEGGSQRQWGEGGDGCSVPDVQYKRPRPGRYHVLEQKEALGVRETIKKEGELSAVRGEERLSHES